MHIRIGCVYLSKPLRHTDFSLPPTLITWRALHILEFLSWFVVRKCELFFFWWASNSWCSTYAGHKYQCVYINGRSLKTAVDHPSWNSGKHSEPTQVHLPGLLWWKCSPGEPGLTPDGSSWLEGMCSVHSDACLTAHYPVVYYDSQADLYGK